MNKTFLIAPLLVTLAAISFLTGAAYGQYRDVVLADNPTAYWRLGEADADLPADNLGLLGDIADGVYTPDAIVGQAPLIAGDADTSLRVKGPAERVTTDPFEKFDEVSGTGGDGFSVEFWTSFRSVPGGFVNLVGDGEGGGDFNLMVYAGAGGFIRPHVQTTDGSPPWTSIDSVRRLEAGEVVHVVSTWDAFSGDLRLFLDGQEADTTLSAGDNPTFGDPVNTDNPIFIGRDGREPSPDAWIDEVALYNYALDPARIAAHYEAGQGASSPPLPEPYPDPGNISGLPDGLVTFIDFDEGAGPNAVGELDFAYDRQGDNNGRFTGTTTRTDGLIGTGAAAFDGTNGVGVNLGSSDDFSVTTGITVETLFTTNWDGTTLSEFFRKEDGGNRILLSFQPSGFINSPTTIGEPGIEGVSFGLNVEGYGELDIAFDGLDGRPTVDDVTDGEVHHIAATYDADSGEKTVYLDGDVIGAVDLFGEIISGGGASAIIGSLNGGEPFDGVIDEFAFWDRALSAAEIEAHVASVQAGNGYFDSGPILQAGDADMDLDFDQLDLVQVLAAGKYLTGAPATWGEGDWNGAPGGTPGDPPPGDGVFNQLDVIEALAADVYLDGKYAALAESIIHVPVPEPGSALLLAMGLTATLAFGYRRRK